jgi:hypothetical protein
MSTATGCPQILPDAVTGSLQPDMGGTYAVSLARASINTEPFNPTIKAQAYSLPRMFDTYFT